MPATPAWPPKSAPRLFVEFELGEGRIFALDGNHAHYLGKVMRVQPGDTVILCDNQTGEWAARVGQVEKRRVDLTVEELLHPRKRDRNVVLERLALLPLRFRDRVAQSPELLRLAGVLRDDRSIRAGARAEVGALQRVEARRRSDALEDFGVFVYAAMLIGDALKELLFDRASLEVEAVFVFG